jgi:hypothetical protein
MIGVPLSAPVAGSKASPWGSAGWTFQLVAGPPESVGRNGAKAELIVM